MAKVSDDKIVEDKPEVVTGEVMTGDKVNKAGVPIGRALTEEEYQKALYAQK